MINERSMTKKKKIVDPGRMDGWMRWDAMRWDIIGEEGDDDDDDEDNMRVHAYIHACLCPVSVCIYMYVYMNGW